MPQTGSLPWLILAAALSIGAAVLVITAMFNPFANAIMGLSIWRGSDLGYANAGMRMVGDFTRNLLIVIVFGIGFGFLLDARRGV